MVVWSTIEACCPVCGNRLRLREVGSGFSTGQDSDLFVRMQGKHIIQAEIHTCHHCCFSGYTDDFLDDISAKTQEMFLRDVAPQLLAQDENETSLLRSTRRSKNESSTKRMRSLKPVRAEKAERSSRSRKATTSGRSPKRQQGPNRCKTTPLPHVQYDWAARTAEALGLSAYEQAHRLLRAYWCLRIAPSANLDEKVLARLRKSYLQQAIRKFRQELRYQKDPHVVFLVAEICRRNGNFALAMGYFRRFLEREKQTKGYLRQAAEKLYLASKERISVELSMEEVLYKPAPDEEVS